MEVNVIELQQLSNFAKISMTAYCTTKMTYRDRPIAENEERLKTKTLNVNNKSTVSDKYLLVQRITQSKVF